MHDSAFPSESARSKFPRLRYDISLMSISVPLALHKTILRLVSSCTRVASSRVGSDSCLRF